MKKIGLKVYQVLIIIGLIAWMAYDVYFAISIKNLNNFFDSPDLFFLFLPWILTIFLFAGVIALLIWDNILTREI